MDSLDKFCTWSLQPGEKVGNYKIIEEIGRGGMGVVYKAIERYSNRFVAMKFILGEQSPLIRKRFLREAQILGQVKHTNIVEIYSVAEHNEQMYLVMEYVNGMCLKELIDTDNIEYAQGIQIVTQVAQALAHLHRKHIIHRDLKPANIMIAKNGTVKVMDFGLAKNTVTQEGTLTRTGLIVGTAQYMAPEQLSGKPKEISDQVDIYALGAILYEIIAKEPMISGSTPLQVWNNIKNFKPHSLKIYNPDLPSSLETVWQRSIANKRYRYKNIHFLLIDLQRVARNQSVRSQKNMTYIYLGAIIAVLLSTFFLIDFSDRKTHDEDNLNLYFQGIVQFDNGSYDEAHQVFISLKNKKESYVMLPYYLGATLYYLESKQSTANAEKINKAIYYLEQVQQKFPFHLDITFVLAKCYLSLKQYPQARKYFNKCMEIAPEESKYYGYLAEIDFEQKEYFKCEKNIRKSMTLDQANLKAANLLFQLSAYAPHFQLDNLQLLNNIFSSLKKIEPPRLFNNEFMFIERKTYNHYLRIFSFENLGEDKTFYLHLAAKTYLQNKSSSNLSKGQEHFKDILLKDENCFTRYLAAKALVRINDFEFLLTAAKELDFAGKIIIYAVLREVHMSITLIENLSYIDEIAKSNFSSSEKAFLQTLLAQGLYSQDNLYYFSIPLSEREDLLLKRLLKSENELAKLAAASSALNLFSIESKIGEDAFNILTQMVEHTNPEIRHYAYYYLWNSYSLTKNNFDYAPLFNKALKDPDEFVNMISISFLFKFVKVIVPNNIPQIFTPGQMRIENQAFLKNIAPLLYELTKKKNSPELVLRASCMWAFSFPPPEKMVSFLKNNNNFPPLFRYFVLRFFFLVDFVLHSPTLTVAKEIKEYVENEEDIFLKVNVCFMIEYLMVSNRFINFPIENGMSEYIKASILNASGLNPWLPFYPIDKIRTQQQINEYLDDKSAIIRQASHNAIMLVITDSQRETLAQKLIHAPDYNSQIGASEGFYNVIRQLSVPAEENFLQYLIFIEPYNRYLLDKRYEAYTRQISHFSGTLQKTILGYFNYAIQFYKQSPKLYYERSLIFAANRNFVDAKKDLVKALELLPEHFRYKVALAEVEYELNNPHQSEKIIQDIPKQEQNPYVLEKVASLYYKMNRYEKAREVYKQLAIQYPYEKSFMQYIIRIYCQQQNKEDALLYVSWLEALMLRKYVNTNNSEDLLYQKDFSGEEFALIQNDIHSLPK